MRAVCARRLLGLDVGALRLPRVHLQEGVVLLDGIDLRRYNVAWLRSFMGLVSQEPALFAETIAYNISYGKPRIQSVLNFMVRG